MAGLWRFGNGLQRSELRLIVRQAYPDFPRSGHAFCGAQPFVNSTKPSGAGVNQLFGGGFPVVSFLAPECGLSVFSGGVYLLLSVGAKRVQQRPSARK